ncbi:Hypothetical predicted protein [Lynx pardinus]|uniref:Uncharacterized protein n=1 Tax=Lynx pardinus TaxID=191816 RepID=A0A485N1J2_LYNPA|nr:Hypothetical predicted protein [Lynx pardinus]
MKPFKNMDYSPITERLLKLAIPDRLIWLTVTLLYAFQKAKAELRLPTRSSSRRNGGTPSLSPASGRTALSACTLALLSTSDTSQAQAPRRQRTCGMTGVLPASAVFYQCLVSIPQRMFHLWAFLVGDAELGLRLHSGHVADAHPAQPQH